MMARSGNLWPLRCPKCENLPPEMGNYSVGKCWDCGALPRANSKYGGSDTFSVNSDEDRNGVVSDKSEQRTANRLSEASGSDTRPIPRSLRHKKVSGDTHLGYRENRISDNRDTIDNLVGKNGLNNSRFGSQFHGDDLGYRETEPRAGSSSGFRRSVQRQEWEILERTEREGFQRLTHYNVHEMQSGEPNYIEGADRVRYLESNKAEILRKIEELKNHLDRSLDAAGRVKEGDLPFNRRRVAPDPYSDGAASIPSRDSKPFFDPHKYDNSNRPFLYPNRDAYDPSDDILRAMPEIHRILWNGDHPNDSKNHPDPRFSGNARSSPKNLENYPANLGLHHSGCSCFHCYSHRKEILDRVPRSTFQQQRFLNTQDNPSYNHHENPVQFGSHVPDFRADAPPESRLDPQRKVLTARRHCRPILGASPFLICGSCFELLQFPKTIVVKSKNQQKIQCGACSTTLNYLVSGKKLVFSFHDEETKEDVVPECEDDSEKLTEGFATPRHHNRDSTMSFEDFDNSGYEFHSVDSGKSNVVSGGNSFLSQDKASFHSSPSVSDGGRGNAVKAPRPAGSSSLQELFNYSTTYHRGGGQLDKGNHSTLSALEKMMKEIDNKVIVRPEFPEEASVATEVEISSNEYSNTGASQDSWETSREDDQARINYKRGVNRIAGSSSDFSKSSLEDEEDEGGIVTVNGHAVPDCLVNKAERMAGRIKPGDYWYDFRAGFWGIMDGPCLGIIPPLIEEFKYSIPEKCSNGDTGVFVNGRELHKKDLDLLSSRGLPKERGKSYIVEISGRVLDEETGEELHRLGKLAPTVAKMKRGFGMRVPRSARPSVSQEE